MSAESSNKRVNPWFDFDLDPILIRSLEQLKDHTNLIARCSMGAHQNESPPWSVLRPMLLCLWEDLECFHEAVHRKHPRAAAMIARGAFEGAVNIMRIVLGGQTVQDAATTHYMQKVFRDLDRKMNLGGDEVRLRWAGLDEVAVPHEAIEARAKYTHKSGGEKTGWIDEAILDKLEEIANARGPVCARHLQLAHLGIYRQSSEIVHGTYCGALYSLGNSAIRWTNAALTARRGEMMEIMTSSLVHVTVELIKVVGERLGWADMVQKADDSHFVYLQAQLAKCEARVEERTVPKPPRV